MQHARNRASTTLSLTQRLKDGNNKEERKVSEVGELTDSTFRPVPKERKEGSSKGDSKRFSTVIVSFAWKKLLVLFFVAATKFPASETQKEKVCFYDEEHKAMMHSVFCKTMYHDFKQARAIPNCKQLISKCMILKFQFDSIRLICSAGCTVKRMEQSGTFCKLLSCFEKKFNGSKNDYCLRFFYKDANIPQFRLFVQ